MKTDLFVKILKYLATFVVGFGIAFLIFHRCNKQPEVVNQISVKDTTPAVTHVPVEKPKPVSVEKPKPPKPIHDTVYQDNMEYFMLYLQEANRADSLWTLLNTRNNYDINLKDDSTALCRWKPSVFNNELQAGGEFTYINRKSTLIQQVQGCKNRFGIGGGIGYYYKSKADSAMNKGISLHISAIFVTKKHLSISADFDPFARYVGGTACYIFGNNKK